MPELLPEGLDPFYNNLEDLLNWLNDEEVLVSTVARWLVTPPNFKRTPEYDSGAPTFIIKVDDLPKLFDAVLELHRQNQDQSEHARVALPYPNKVELGLTKSQIKMIIDYACRQAGTDVIELLRALAVGGY